MTTEKEESRVILLSGAIAFITTFGAYYLQGEKTSMIETIMLWILIRIYLQKLI